MSSKLFLILLITYSLLRWYCYLSRILRTTRNNIVWSYILYLPLWYSLLSWRDYNDDDHDIHTANYAFLRKYSWNTSRITSFERNAKHLHTCRCIYGCIPFHFPSNSVSLSLPYRDSTFSASLRNRAIPKYPKQTSVIANVMLARAFLASPLLFLPSHE